jgi:CubicO group peptidase (beta-lactamase class C family)
MHDETRLARSSRQRITGIAALVVSWASLSVGSARAQGSADELVGLWSARSWFGSFARGILLLEKESGEWSADFMGKRFGVQSRGATLELELPNGEGRFSLRLERGGRRFTGHFISPRSRIYGARYATPVVLDAVGPDRFRGEVVPREDEVRLYLKIVKRPDGSVGAFLRNPEYNLGVFYNVDRVAREGAAVKLIGKMRGQKQERVLFLGAHDAESGILSIPFPSRGGTYDFRRDSDPSSDFYPRGARPERYTYRPPPARDDGWATATLEEVDIDRSAIEKLVQMIIDMPIETVETPEVEGILIARHGKLVLEEYFHGEHRDKLHDTRSAAKSLTATLIGAALHAKAPVALSTPVYRAMYGGRFPAELDPRKRTMTLEHLLMMRAGFFCDDTNPDAPGNEEVMHEQTGEPDYYRFTLALPLDRQPGEKSVYCSIDPNLALGVLKSATGESVLDLFDRSLAGPLQIRRYAWILDPAGNPYGGGSVQFLPRDLMKLGQLMLDGGTWRGRRILSREFVSRASAPLHDLRGIQYGYLWWSIEYPYKDRSIRAFFAGGNGGQGVMVVPDLDLVIATYGGNYNSRVGVQIQQEYPPNYVLTAVRERGDDKSRPVIPGKFITPYGNKPN